MQLAAESIGREEMIAIAVARHRAGDAASASSIYQEVLRSDAGNAGVLYLLGVCEHQSGRLTEADLLFRRAIDCDAAVAAFHLGLGRNLKEQGRYEDATRCYRRALEISPDSMEATVSLGIALWRGGRFDEAIDLLSAAGQRDPGSYEVIVNLGNALFHGGQPVRAVEAYRRAAALRPDAADAHNNLGRALKEAGEPVQARAAFEQALRILPAHAEALFNLGNILLGEGDLDGAARNFASAVDNNPVFADGFAALAKVLYDAGFFDEALAFLDRFIALRPVDPKAHLWRGLVLRDRGDMDEALAAFDRAQTLDPNSAEGPALTGSTLWMLGEHGKAAQAAGEAYARDPAFPPVLNLLGNLSLLEWRLEESLEWYRKAVTVDPGYNDAADNLLFVSNYSDRNQADQLFELHRTWGGKQGAARPTQRTLPSASTGRLRVGFVSPDFNQHSVSYFLDPLLRNFNCERFELFAYYNNRRIDTATQALGALVEWWRPIAGMTDSAVAKLVDDDCIDVLIDLAGHTGDNRLGVFALRPAPVQMTWLGYPTTTGLPQIDYRLTDALVDPEIETSRSTERLLRLPASYFCYRPPEDAPAVTPLPAQATGSITFCSFNNLAKVSASTVRIWSAVLAAAPGSRLVVKNRALASEEVVDRLLGQFEMLGIESSRIVPVHWQAQTASHLATYCKADIALDTFPYNGATTTCEALWMGVPVVTLHGETHASRMGASILSAAGLQELIATSEEEFVRIAIGLSGDPLRLEKTRMGLREKMTGSALMDHAGFARAFEATIERAIQSA